MSQKPCENCGQPFTPHPNRGKRFCSNRCSHEYRSKTGPRSAEPIAGAAPCCEPGCVEPRYARSRRCLLHMNEHRRKNAPPCSVSGCSGWAKSGGLCTTHYSRLRRTGTVEARPRRSWVNASNGYVSRIVDGRAKYEHRLMMERLIGRDLASDEQVHHVNGDRADNRPENLELWSTSQPSGQRVEDKVAWAIAMIRRYEPGLLVDGPVREVPTSA